MGRPCAPTRLASRSNGVSGKSLLVYIAVCLLRGGYCSVSPQSSVRQSGSSDDLLFTAEPTDQVVSKNASAVIDCGAPIAWLQHRPPPLIEWRRDGVLLNFLGDARRSLLSNGSLYFSSVHQTRSERPDEGVYQCVATLPSVGTLVSRWAKLQVSALPRFESEPRDVIVRVGDTARFNCYVASGAAAGPSLDFTWLKDERPLDIDQARMQILPSGALELDDVQLPDQGYYRCNVTNGDKFRVSTDAKLSVLSELEGGGRPEAPTFLAVPRNTAAAEGSTVTLECAANGNPRPEVTWLKDGTTIDVDDLDSRFHRIGSGSLRIDDVRESDVGAYQCRAENAEDSADATASLDVHVAPRYVKRPQSVAAHEKEDAELECQVVGRPEPTVQWTKNGELIIESEYFQVVNGHNLKILGLVASDFGIYQCLASNAAGNVQAAASLTIVTTADVGNSSTPTELDATDDPAAVAAAAGATPPAAWPTAEATDATDESAEAEATNSSGSAAAEGSVPSAPRHVEALIVSARFVTLRWKEPLATNGPIVGYSVLYRQEGSERERAMNTSRSRLEELNVAGLQPGKKYSMRVVAYNEHGAGASSEPLDVETHLEPHVLPAPTNLVAAAASPVSLVARWQPPESVGGTPIRNYKLFYMEVGSAEEHEIVTTHTTHLIHGLRPYTDYSVWAVAFNDNGPGTSTEEVAVRTWSDVPADTPQNVAAEPASSTSIIVRWEPPAKEHQNGIITGYKIRYKPKSQRQRGGPLVSSASSTGSTATTDGSRRLMTLTGLMRNTEYQIRVSALTVNGSGPMTDWIVAETFENDLDESQVPEPPSALRARPMSSSIAVSWNPPSNQNVMVRGYTIGWGKGIPDVYTKLVDGKQRVFVIEKLEANSEYVISLRAFNQMGDGRPIYETVRTREESTPEPPTPLIPPVGLKAIVLSSTTVVLYWTDTSLPRNQMVTDSRYYAVRYTSSHTSSNPRYRYLNSTVLNCMLDDLKPNTQYEFAVKVIKNRRESPWSLVVPNTTFEAAPSSPPRDLTVVLVEDNPSAINLNWQPPKQPNGQITGYVIFYTTDNTQRDRDWVVEGVVGDKMTTTVKGMTPDTTYFLKIQARNNKGYGPFSSVIQFRTNPSNGHVFHDAASRDGRGISSTTLYIALGVAAGIILILLVVVLLVVFRRRDGSTGGSPDRSKKGYVKGNVKGKLGKADNPPDLWIHHDQMEMKGMDKSQRCNSATTVSPMARRSQDLDSLDGMPSGSTTGPRSAANADDSLDRRGGYVTAYAAVATATPVPNGSLNQHSDSRPVYPVVGAPRPLNYGVAAGGNPVAALSRAHVTVDVSSQPSDNSMYSTNSGSYDSRASLINPPPPPAAVVAPTPCQPSPLAAGAAEAIKRQQNQGHPLKSFTVPAPPPPQSAPPIKMVSPLNSHRPANPTASPYKSKHHPMASPSPIIRAAAVSSAGGLSGGGVDVSSPAKLQPSYSTEELNQEMANLEGLMKDLNAIASASSAEFGC